ncbi:hypothetical protein ARMGADRAFT_1146715 [Armillaria gallica]|uniref:Uncharacterized protein n=1 Tax=Armillaria gallica TaxID=47427 RepID=A0A2H3CDH0_ARMGA|nr:hypothetical protein ARMGADRAFT_1146715 [Armillaria gallica]
MSSQPSQAIPSLGDTFGALFVGAIISAILFGITNLQTLIYYKKYPNDSSLYRYSVALLWVLDALHVALGTHALYYYLIDMYGNFLGALIANVWTMKLQLVLKARCHVPSNLLYLNGFPLDYTLSDSGNLDAIFTKPSLGSWCWNIYITPNLVSISVINTSVYTFYSIIITADFIIAVMMCYYLHKSRAAMHFSSFNYRDQRSWNRSTNEDTRHSITAILQFAPNNSEGLTTETDRSLPLSEIKDIETSDKSGISKGTVDSEV